MMAEEFKALVGALAEDLTHTWRLTAIGHCRKRDLMNLI